MSKAVSLIIPTYNERDNITPLVARLDRALSHYDYEVIFVDDNSTDGTGELVTALSAKYPLKLMVRKDKRGLASAVVDGLKYARSQTVVVMDADLQHPPELIPDLLRKIEAGASIAIASRYIRGGSYEGWGLSRRVMSRGAILLAHLFLPQTRGVSDITSGFFAFDKQVIANADLRPTGYKILLEIVVQGQTQRMAEVPYSFRSRYRGQSKLGTRQQIDYLKHLYSLMRRRGELTRFVRFCLVGASGILVNMGLLWLLTEVAGLFYLFSAAVSIESSIISNFALNDFFTFPDRRAPGTKPFLRRLVKFNLVSLAGLGLNMAVLWTLTDLFGVYYLLSNLCGIVVATLWNYLVNFWWTWK